MKSSENAEKRPGAGEEDFQRILEELQDDAVSPRSLETLGRDGRLLLDVIHTWNALKRETAEEPQPELEAPTAPSLDALLQEALLRYGELRKEMEGGGESGDDQASQPELTPPQRPFTQVEYARLLARVLSGEEPELPAPER